MDKVIYRFIGFSFSVYSIHTHRNLIHIFSALRMEYFYISFTIHISRSHGKIFHFQLHHHACLIKLTLLQLHNRIPLINLTNITLLHHNYSTCSILTLHHSSIPSRYSEFIVLQIHLDFQLPHLPFTFGPLTQRYVAYSICNYIWNTSKLLLLSGDVEINPEPQPIDRNPVFCSICSNKINCGAQQDMAPTCFDENCNARYHQVCNGLSISQTRNILNMALESPKLLIHLLQFTNFQIVPLLLENLAPFAKIIFVPVMPT